MIHFFFIVLFSFTFVSLVFHFNRFLFSSIFSSPSVQNTARPTSTLFSICKRSRFHFPVWLGFVLGWPLVQLGKVEELSQGTDVKFHFANSCCQTKPLLGLHIRDLRKSGNFVLEKWPSYWRSCHESAFPPPLLPLQKTQSRFRMRGKAQRFRKCNVLFQIIKIRSFDVIQI